MPTIAATFSPAHLCAQPSSNDGIGATSEGGSQSQGGSLRNVVIWGTNVSVGDIQAKFKNFIMTYSPPDDDDDTPKYLRLLDQVPPPSRLSISVPPPRQRLCVLTFATKRV